MSNQIRRLAYLIKHDIDGVEQQQDRHLAHLARAIATMCDASAETKVPAEVGHDAITCAAEVLQLQVAARAKTVELHGKLAVLAGRMHIPELATGGPNKESLVKIITGQGNAAAATPRTLPVDA